MPSLSIQDAPPTAAQCMRFSSGFVAVVGRPSVGKSSFINAVCGHNTAITSRYPQTTRSIIRGIVTREAFQIVFLDTPGVHNASSAFGLRLYQHALQALEECDGIVYMVDVTRAPKAEEAHVAQLVSSARLKSPNALFVVCNKCDNTDAYASTKGEYAAHFARFFTEAQVHCVSAETGEGLEELLRSIAGILPVHAPFYPKDYYTDQSAEFRICEQVRGAAIERLSDELPHALYTRVIESSVKHHDAQGVADHVLVRVELVVETESQLGIVVGKGGAMIRAIRLAASKRIAKLFSYKVQLQLRVGVDKKWRKRSKALS